MRQFVWSIGLVGLAGLVVGCTAATGNGPVDDGGVVEGSGGTIGGSGGSITGSGGKGGVTGSGGKAGSGGVVGSGGKTGSGGGIDCNPGGGELTGPYDSRVVQAVVENVCRAYRIQNNVWGSSGSQTLTYSGPSFTVTQQTGNGGSAPASYPSLFIGSNNGRTTANSNLPKQVSALTTVPTSFSHNAGQGPGGSYNASYDVWFSTTSAGDPKDPSGGFLMVWSHKPGDKQPIGSVQWGNATVSGVSGTWNVWNGPHPQLGIPVISYVSTSTTNSMTFDLNAFIKDAVAKGVIKNNWYLSNVFAGFEIWNGGVGLKVNSFSVLVK